MLGGARSRGLRGRGGRVVGGGWGGWTLRREVCGVSEERGDYV